MAVLHLPRTHKRQVVNFQCAFDVQLGAYSLGEGEALKAVEDTTTGRFDLYVEWGEGSLGKFSAARINELAGYEAVWHG